VLRLLSRFLRFSYDSPGSPKHRRFSLRPAQKEAADIALPTANIKKLAIDRLLPTGQTACPPPARY